MSIMGVKINKNAAETPLNDFDNFIRAFFFRFVMRIIHKQQTMNNNRRDFIKNWELQPQQLLSIR